MRIKDIDMKRWQDYHEMIDESCAACCADGVQVFLAVAAIGHMT